jgi:gliding motility-associated lipoprotein GldH
MFCKTKIFLAAIFLCSILACVKGNRFEQIFYAPAKGLSSNTIHTFQFDIADTNARYNWLLLFQHTYNYDFNNIWLNIRTVYPDGKVELHKQEIPVAFPDGRWMGRCVNNICTQEINMGPDGAPLKFEQKGKYTISFQQIMRQDPLMDVGYLGMALERIGK